MSFLYIPSCILFTVFGQILIKHGAVQVKEAQSIWLYITNTFIIMGLLSALIAAVSWIKAMQYYDLSYAYPFMSLSFLIVAALSVAFFGETMKWTQWVGLMIVVLGLIIASK